MKVWSSRTAIPEPCSIKLVALLFSITNVLERKVLLVADAYYASGKFIAQLLANGHQLVTRAKSNAVAYLPVPAPTQRRRGRPRIYGEKVRLKDFAQDEAAFTSAPSPVFGENNVTLSYRCLDLIWRPAARIVRFVIVRHPHRGTIFLLCTDLTLGPLEILLLYGYRFRIELGFRQAVHVLGAYSYHFWMSAMKPLRRGDGNQYLHRTSDPYRAAIRRKLGAFHVHVQLGCIAQGLLQHLGINHTAAVWRCFRSWLRTMNPALPPSEMVTANALRAAIPAFFSSSAMDPNLKKIIDQYSRPDIPLGSEQRAA